MAKKRKSKKSVPAKASDLIKMPSASAVESLATELGQAGDRTRKASAAIAERLAAGKAKGIHTAALRHVVALKRKADASDRARTAVATRRLHEDYYADLIGLTALLDRQSEMFARPEAGQADEPPAETNVTSFPAKMH